MSDYKVVVLWSGHWTRSGFDIALLELQLIISPELKVQCVRIVQKSVSVAGVS